LEILRLSILVIVRRISGVSLVFDEPLSGFSDLSWEALLRETMLWLYGVKKRVLSVLVVYDAELYCRIGSW